MTVHAVLLDIDGTLVDSNGFHVSAWRRAFAQAGQDIACDRIAAEIGKGGDLLIPALLPDAGPDESDAIEAHHGEIFKADYIDRVRPFPNAGDLVRRIHATGARVVLASSASGAELDHYVALLGIADVVDATITSDDVETSKPAPDIFSVAIKRAGDPKAIVAVGDSPYDIEAAGRCGVPTIALLSGGFPRERLAEAVAIYADAADLLACFDESPLAT